MGERLDREIEEILINYEKHAKRRRRRTNRGLWARFKTRLQRIQPPRNMTGSGQLMLAGLIAILFAFSFAAFMPQTLKQWILVAGVVLFALGLIIAIARGYRRPTPEMRWRGRVIRMEDQRFRSRVRGWFHRRDR